ncbi:MAG: radical SAM protein [Nanoarchaeota archaeon]|nr:radical SAM protein [Nanoarchaeota archaeon]
MREKPAFKPYSAIIECSRLCNLSCSLCIVSQTGSSFKQEFLKLDDFMRFIDQNPQLIFLFFGGFGEPTLNNDFKKMIDYAKKKRILTILSTNGIMNLNDISPDFVIFSLDFVDEETYKTHKGQNVLKRIKENIKNYNNDQDKKSLTFLQFLINSYNEKNINELINANKDLGCDYVLLKKAIIFSPDFSKYENTCKEYKNILHPNRKYRCSFLYYSTKLNSDGSISVCCNDMKRKFDLGNIKNIDFEKIWKSVLYKEIRRKSNTNKPVLQICRYCQKLHKSPYFVDIIPKRTQKAMKRHFL